MRGLTWSMQDVAAGIQQFMKTACGNVIKQDIKFGQKNYFTKRKFFILSNYKASLHHLFPGLAKF